MSPTFHNIARVSYFSNCGGILGLRVPAQLAVLAGGGDDAGAAAADKHLPLLGWGPHHKMLKSSPA